MGAVNPSLAQDINERVAEGSRNTTIKSKVHIKPNTTRKTRLVIIPEHLSGYEKGVNDFRGPPKAA